MKTLSTKQWKRILKWSGCCISGTIASGLLLYNEAQKISSHLSLHHSHNLIPSNFPNYYITHPTSLSEGARELITDSRMWYNWLQSHSHNVVCLLQLTESSDKLVRQMGIKALSEQTKWTDAQYMRVAQCLNTRNLISLARYKSTDPRFFLKPPKFRVHTTRDMLEHQLNHTLSSLSVDDVDKCTAYYTQNALDQPRGDVKDTDDLWSLYSDDPHAIPTPDMAQWSKKLRFCIQALLSHSTLQSHCSVLLQLGVIETLRRIYDLHVTNVTILKDICKIIGNLAVHEKIDEEVTRAGFSGILHSCLHSNNLALQSHATRALYNLDTDSHIDDLQDNIEPTKHDVYDDGVYLLHPLFKSSKQFDADVIVVHGLLGGPFLSWRQNDDEKHQNGSNNISGNGLTVEEQPRTNITLCEQSANIHRDDKSIYTNCWPKDWLPTECKNIRVLAVEYESYLNEWGPKSPYGSEKRSLCNRSSELLKKLRRAGVGDRPIIWVAHSMGGLLVKQMLSMSHSDPVYHPVLDRSEGLVFYSVPHHGSPLAVLGKHTKYLFYPSVEVTELTEGAEVLEALHKSFTSIMFEHGIPLLSFGEGIATSLKFGLKIMIVPQESSDPGFGEFHVMDELSHLDICKPHSQHSELYRLTVDFIKDCLHSAQGGDNIDTDTMVSLVT